MWNTCLWLRLPSPDGPILYTPIPPSFGVVVGWDALLGQPASSKRVDVPLISSSRFSTCDRELPREQPVVLEGVFLLALCDHFSSKSKSCSVTKIKLYLKKKPKQPTTPALCKCDATTFLSKEKLISEWAARGSWFVHLLIQARGVNMQVGYQGWVHTGWFPAPPQNCISGAGYKLLFLISRNCNSEFVTIHICNSCWSQ